MCCGYGGVCGVIACAVCVGVVCGDMVYVCVAECVLCVETVVCVLDVGYSVYIYIYIYVCVCMWSGLSPSWVGKPHHNKHEKS